MKLWDDEIRKIKPDATFIPNSGGGVGNSLDWKRFGEMSETLGSNGMAANVFRSAAGNKAIIGIFGINVATPSSHFPLPHRRGGSRRCCFRVARKHWTFMIANRHPVGILGGVPRAAGRSC